MECSINIKHFKVNSLSSNGNINLGATYQNSHTANSSFIGCNFNLGNNCIISSKNFIRGDGQALKENSPRKTDSEN